MAHVLVSAPLPGDALERLGSLHRVEIGETPTGLGRDGIRERIGDKQALVSLLSDRIDESVLDAAKELRVIANYAVGVDNIDLEACRRRGIVVTNTPGVLTDATADLAMALLLSTARRIVEADALARSGEWKGWAPTEMLGMRVSSATIGIIGFGRIGRAMAKRAAGFGMRVLYNQRRRASLEDERAVGASYVTLDELVRTSDIVSLHCPLTDETRGLLSRERLFAMKKGAIVVNTARGACIDEQALIEAIATGHLGGAGLDVFEKEPFIPAELRALDRVVLAPHIGSADEPTRAEMARMCVSAVLDVLEGREPEHRVA